MAVIPNGTDKPCDLRWRGDIDAEGMHDWVCIKHYGHVYVHGPNDRMSDRPTSPCPNVEMTP